MESAERVMVQEEEDKERGKCWFIQIEKFA
jgi:hypothetical protein